MIYDNFVRLCASVGKSPSAVAQELGINKSTVSNWKRRKNGPSDVTLEKMVQYFNVPVSELTGEGQKNSPPPGGDGLRPLQREAWDLVLRLSDEQLEQFSRVTKAMFNL